jgi:hypothetical protein
MNWTQEVTNLYNDHYKSPMKEMKENKMERFLYSQINRTNIVKMATLP